MIKKKLKLDYKDEYIQHLHDLIDYLETQLHNQIISAYQERINLPEKFQKKDKKTVHRFNRYQDSLPKEMREE